MCFHGRCPLGRGRHNVKIFCVYICVCYTLLTGNAARRRQTSFDVATLLLMAPIDPWRNSTPIFGALAFCTTNIEDFRTHLTSMSSTISSTYSSQKRSLRWTSSKRKIMEVIAVDQLEETNNKRLSWALPHSRLKAKNDPKEKDDLRQKTTFGKRRPSTKDDLLWKTTFNWR